MTCYRHPGREAYVRCQRCERVICPECQVEASVGFLCPACAGGTPTQISAARRRAARLVSAGARPTVSISLIVINAIVWLLQVLPNSVVTEQLVFSPLAFALEPWRAISAGFAHSQDNFLHLALNMYSLYVFGQVLEPMLGKARFLAMYLISIIGGSAAVMWLSSMVGYTLGASGAVFGLMGAYFVIARKLGAQGGQLFGLIAINLAFGFFMPGISWQAHVGGLAAGCLVALLYVNTRQLNQKTQQLLGLIGIFALVVGVLYAGLFLRVFPALGL
jgi:membrane associated rhomboid family serine protease